MSYKIIATLDYHGYEAFVLNRAPKLKYTKYDGHTIVGVDGIFCAFYKYSEGNGYIKAFGGRKFDLQLTSGEVEHCHGQWWSDITPKGIEVIGEPIINVIACDRESFVDLYVFEGYYATVKGLNALKSEYAGPVYKYEEYCEMIKKGEV